MTVGLWDRSHQYNTCHTCRQTVFLGSTMQHKLKARRPPLDSKRVCNWACLEWLFFRMRSASNDSCSDDIRGLMKTVQSILCFFARNMHKFDLSYQVHFINPKCWRRMVWGRLGQNWYYHRSIPLWAERIKDRVLYMQWSSVSSC